MFFEHLQGNIIEYELYYSSGTSTTIIIKPLHCCFGVGIGENCNDGSELTMISELQRLKQRGIIFVCMKIEGHVPYEAQK
jgi:hypothetical protein